MRHRLHAIRSLGDRVWGAILGSLLCCVPLSCNSTSDGTMSPAGQPSDATIDSGSPSAPLSADDASSPDPISDIDGGLTSLDAAAPSPESLADAAAEEPAPATDARVPDSHASDAAGKPDAAADLLLDQLRSLPYPDPPHPEGNPYTEAKALLGKILFWEEQLSGDDSVACGTCHRASAGGSDPRSAEASAQLPGLDGMFGTDDDIQGSPGIFACDESGVTTGDSLQVTGRKAPSYLDAMFARRLFWDGRAECAKEACPSIDAFEDPDNPGTFPLAAGAALEIQAAGPPLNTVEMACAGTTWPDLHEKLSNVIPLALASDIPEEMVLFIRDHQSSYPELFRAAFGAEHTSGPETEINTRRIVMAIATHERRLTSNQTPFDHFNAGDDDALTPAQLRGLHVFRLRAQCSSCHLPPIFSDGAFHFTGFHRPSLDPGRGAITERASDTGEMRTPTLRNVALRVEGGLLHNGSGLGASLETILETYVAGGLRDDAEVVAVPITESIEPLDLSEQEVADLVEFLVGGLTDPRVAAELPPFDRPRLSTE